MNFIVNFKSIQFKSYMFILLGVLLFALSSCSEQKEFTITFDTLTNQHIESITTNEGQAIFEPDVPNREGYRFDGWFYQDEPFVFSIMPNKDLKLTAKWSQYFEIIFDVDGGSEMSPIMIAEGDDIILSEEPEKNHYKFFGWSYMDETFDLVKMPSENLNLKAVWVPASTITFQAVVYDRYIGDFVELSVKSIVEVPGTEITAPEIPEYPEYKFLKWQLDGLDYDFSTMPNEDLLLTAEWIELSNLPALFIDLYNQFGSSIPIEYVNRETYVNSSISLVNTDEIYELNQVEALFKGRGNGSWVDSGDKKGYRIKFDDQQSVLGNPSSKHWVILAGANFDDVTMLRNKLAFDMTNEIFTNIEYATSTAWVDVYFNNEYHGVYLICEHVRVDDDRINIDSEFGVLDTGYLVEYDAYASGVNGVDFFRVDGLKYPFTVKSPSPEDYLEESLTTTEYREQVSYIQTMVSQMVSAALNKDLEAFSEVADVNSFVDMYILHELFKNIDTGYSSFFIYRNPGGKLYAGPPWDFDATLGSTPTRGNGSPNGIYVGLAVQAFSPRTANELFISLYATPEFKDIIVSRWKEISSHIVNYINQTLTDEMIENYRFALGRNYVRWPSPQGYGSPISQENAEDNWVINVGKAKKWLLDRVIWLDGEWF